MMLAVIQVALETIAAGHKVFFPAVRRYFKARKEQVLLEAFGELDSHTVHEKQARVIADLEGRP
jgi:hypothetical protein